MVFSWSQKTVLHPSASLLGAKDATRNKCIASSNKCLTSSNKKLLGISASLLGAKLFSIQVGSHVFSLKERVDVHVRARAYKRPGETFVAPGTLRTIGQEQVASFAPSSDALVTTSDALVTTSGYSPYTSQRQNVRIRPPPHSEPRGAFQS